MINRDELLKIARESGFERTKMVWHQMYADEDQVIDFANAILERAAVECERSEMYRGSIFAARIRKLKEPQE